MKKIITSICMISLVSILYADTVDIYSHVILKKSEHTSSSKLMEKDKPENYYGPEKAFDGDPGTAWCEGKNDEGIGEYITVETKPVKIYGVVILNGFGKYKHLYMQNNRVRDFRLTLYPDNGKEKIIEGTFRKNLCGQALGNMTVEEMCEDYVDNKRQYSKCVADKNDECIISDEMYNYGGQKIVLKKALIVRKIKLEILSVYKGEKYNDTCISEFRLLNYRNNPKDFDMQTKGHEKY